MKNIYCIKQNKYRKVKNPKISYIVNKTLHLCISNDGKIFKDKESIKILDIINNIEEYQMNI